MMYKVSFLLTCAILKTFGDEDSLLSKFHQTTYKLKDIRTELLSYNKDVFKYLEIKTFKFNRSITAINITLMTKTNKDAAQATLLVQAFKFASNEYRRFPLRFQVNILKAIMANIVGVKDNIKKCGRVPENLFLEKDIKYYVCNALVDATHLPPLIPVGIYMAELTVFDEDQLAQANLYLEIYVPIKIEN